MDRQELIARLAWEVARAPQGMDTSAKVCWAACQILGADGGSVTVSTATPDRVTLCVTDDTAARLEAAQDVLGNGPCMAAYLSGSPIVADQGTLQMSWPLFADLIRPTDVTQIYALPIQGEAAVVGVLSLYQCVPADLHHDMDAAAFLVDAVGASMLGDATSKLLRDDLDAWPSRRDIHQATGMVIAQLAISQADSLAILRAHAYAQETDLASIAQAVISRDLTFDSSLERGIGSSGPRTGNERSDDA